MSREPVVLPTSALIFNQLNVRGFWMTEWLKEHSKDAREEMLTDVMTLAKDQKMIMWTQTFPFSEFQQALEAVTTQRSNEQRKVVLLMKD